MSLIGLDVGTSGCKAGIFDSRGKLLSMAHREYSAICSRPGWAEMDADVIWNCVQAVLAEAAAVGQNSGLTLQDPPRALSVSSFGESVVPLGADGRCLGPVILYHDPRGGAEAEAIDRALGSSRLYSLSGARPHGMYSLGKIAWIKTHEPELFGKVWKFLLMADFVLFRLGAEARTDYSLAARTMAFDVTKLQWSSEIFAAAGLSTNLLPEPIPSGTTIGTLSGALVQSLGLPADLKLVSGGHDQTCAALGAGVTRAGSSVDGMGTVECITPAFDRPVINSFMESSHFACVPHVVPGLYVTYAFNLAAGGLLRWYRDVLAGEERAEARTSGLNVYELILEEVPGGPGRLLFLPHITGAATPYMDPGSRGAIVGLEATTTKADIVRGLLEGLCFEMRINLDLLSSAGITVDELRTVGGLAQSEKILALKADILQRPVLSLDVTEAGTLGAALLAGVACGEFSSLAEAADACVRIKKEFLPHPRHSAAYEDLFLRYAKLYPALKEIRTCL